VVRAQRGINRSVDTAGGAFPVDRADDQGGGRPARGWGMPVWLSSQRADR